MSQGWTADIAQQIHRAVRLHFARNSSYDFFKYNGKLRGSNDAKVTHTPAWSFALLTREFSETEFPFYLAFMFYKKPRVTIQELRSKEHWAEWKKWKERQKNRVQYLNDELKYIKPSDFEVRRHEYPALLGKIGNKVSIDTFVIVDSILQLTKQWEEKLKNDFAFLAWLKSYRKWRTFFFAYMPYDRDTFLKIVQEELT